MRDALNIGLRDPLTDIKAAAVKPVLYRLHGGDSTARSFAGSGQVVQPGYPTIITLGSSPTVVAGGWVAVSGVVGMTQLNGTWRVLYTSGSSVALDVDSGTFSAYASGGTVTPTVMVDEFGAGPTMAIQGTVTGVYSSAADGLTAHSAGSNSLLQQSGLSAFDLTGFRGCLVLGAAVNVGASTSADEAVIACGVYAANASGSAAGAYALMIDTGRSAKLQFRPAGATDTACPNTFAYSGVLTAGQLYRVAFVLDLTGAPGAGQAHCMLNGSVVRSAALTMTGATDTPHVSAMAVGASLSSALTLQNKLGSTASGAKVQDLIVWKSQKSLTDTLRAMRRWHRARDLSLMA